MNRLNHAILKGAFIAATVGGFFAAGSNVAQAEEKDGDTVACEGINSCKGKGACAGAGHGCSGQNGCKGQGQMKVTKKECLAKGGKIAAAKPEDKSKSGDKAPDPKTK